MTMEQFLQAVSIISEWDRSYGDVSNSFKIGSFDTTVRLWDCRSQNTAPIQIIEDCKDSVMSLQVCGVELIVG